MREVPLWLGHPMYQSIDIFLGYVYWQPLVITNIAMENDP